MRHLERKDRTVADTLLQTEIKTLEDDILSQDLLADEENYDFTLQNVITVTLKFQELSPSFSIRNIYWDVSLNTPRPYIPTANSECLSQSSKRAIVKLISSCSVLTNTKSDIRSWVSMCLEGQICKIHKHTISLDRIIGNPDTRFSHIHVDLVGRLPIYPLKVVDRFF